MNTIRIIIIACIINTLFAADTRAQDVKEILEKHVQAMGGMDNWKKIKTIQLAGIKTSTNYQHSSVMVNGVNREINTVNKAESRAKIIIAPGDAMKFDDESPGNITHQALVINNGWVRFLTWRKKTDSLSIGSANAWWPMLDLENNLLLNYPANETKVEYAGTDTINGVYCYKIRSVDKYSNETFSFIDTATYYLLCTKSILAVNGKEKPVEVSYSNYTITPEGIVMPMVITTGNYQVEVEQIEINVPVNDSTFKPSPPETK